MQIPFRHSEIPLTYFQLQLMYLWQGGEDFSFQWLENCYVVRWDEPQFVVAHATELHCHPRNYWKHILYSNDTFGFVNTELTPWACPAASASPEIENAVGRKKELKICACVGSAVCLPCFNTKYASLCGARTFSQSSDFLGRISG